MTAGARPDADVMALTQRGCSTFWGNMTSQQSILPLLAADEHRQEVIIENKLACIFKNRIHNRLLNIIYAIKVPYYSLPQGILYKQWLDKLM